MTKQTKKPNVLTMTSFKQKVAGVSRSGQSIQKNIHTLAIDALQTAENLGGDFTKLNLLYQALPKAIRRGTFVAWVNAHSPSRFVTKKTKQGNRIKVFTKSKAKDANPFDLANASKKPFQDFEAPKGTNEAEPLSEQELNKKVVSYIKRLEAQAKKTDPNCQKVVSYAEKLIEKISA